MQSAGCMNEIRILTITKKHHSMQTEKQCAPIGKDYFCRVTTNQLKGYLALGVLVHHTFQCTQFIPRDTVLGSFLSCLGGYCVSLFFFISGYGLLTSFSNRWGGI